MSAERSRASGSRNFPPLRTSEGDNVGGERSVSGPSRLTRVDAAVHRLLVARSLTLLRWAVGVIFLYFGALKLVPGFSPAESLVIETINAMTFDLIPGRISVAFTGAVECGLGVLLITGWFRRLTIYLLGLELLGILAPLVLLPTRLFDSPAMPTIEGQYVLKDIILVAAGMVLATTIRGGRLVTGPDSAQPTSRQRAPDGVSVDEKLRIVLESIRADHTYAEAARAHGITPQEYRRWRDELLEGGAANMRSPQGPEGAERARD